jgi:hypothetical protein
VEGCIQREEVHLACERAHPRGRGTHTWIRRTLVYRGRILEEEALILGLGTLLCIEGAIECEGALVGVG